jgi:multicomponent Na+:H+ antiporter subunit A
VYGVIATFGADRLVRQGIAESIAKGQGQRYGILSIGVFLLVGLLALLAVARPDWHWPALAPLPLPVLGAALLIAAGALAALFVRDHLVLLLVSGLVGYGSAVLFLFTGAPDLAFTQFAVETVFVVVAATVLLKVRSTPSLCRMAATVGGLQLLPLGVALAFGGVMTALLLLVSGLPFDAALSDFYGAQSVPAAHGRNVVNLILVDFRALDTLGEIAVLLFALLAALPLLKLAGRKRP